MHWGKENNFHNLHVLKIIFNRAFLGKLYQSNMSSCAARQDWTRAEDHAGVIARPDISARGKALALHQYSAMINTSAIKAV